MFIDVISKIRSRKVDPVNCGESLNRPHNIANLVNFVGNSTSFFNYTNVTDPLEKIPVYHHYAENAIRHPPKVGRVGNRLQKTTY